MALRPTAAVLLLREAHPYTLIAAHWPQKAQVRGEFSLTTAGGGINPGELPEEAARREISEEYGLRGVSLVRVPLMPMEAHGKLFHWFIGLVGKAPFLPDETEVAAVHWYSGPSAFSFALAEMHEEKRRMVCMVIQHAPAPYDTLLLPYRTGL